MTSRLACLALSSALFLGCSSSDPGGPGDDTGDPDQGDVDPVAGRYELTSHYDLSQAEGVPELVSEALGSLTGLAEDPAGTLIGILDEANLPVVDDLLGALPSLVRDQLENLLNDAIQEQLYQGAPVAEEIVAWADQIATILTDFEVVSTLDVGSLNGNVSATHVMAGVAFELDGARRLIDTPELVDQLTQARDVSCQIDQAGSSERITLADHAFNLPLGDFAVTAVNQAIAAKFGVPDLAGALGLLIPCDQIAEQVASQCLGPVCVGHQTEIEALCVAGLGQIADKIEERIAAIDYAAIHLAAGQGILIDGKADVADGSFDAIEQGTWQAGFDLDGRRIDVAATFTGARIE